MGLSPWLPLILLFSAASFSALQKSTTYDEPVFLTSGAYYLRTGDVRYNAENPPFLKSIYALPTLFFPEGETFNSVPSDVLYTYNMGREFSQANDMLFSRPQPLLLIFLCRLMPMVLACGTGYLLYRISRSWWGHGVALVLLWLFAFSPNVLAHARLVTADMGCVFFFLLSAAAVDRFLKDQRIRTSVLLGLSIGVLLLTKFTGILMLFAFLLQVIIFYAFRKTHVSGRKLFLRIVPVFVIVLVVINTAYGFSGTGQKLSAMSFKSDMMKNIANTPVAGACPMPVPTGYVKGYDIVAYHNQQGLPNIFMGDFYPEGGTWWYYYVVVLALKVPLLLLLIFIAGCVVVIREHREVNWTTFCVYIIPPVFVFLNFSLVAYRQLGLRYILPVWPFLFMIAGAVVYRYKDRFPRRQTVAVGVGAGVWYLLSSLLICPDYLSYFNMIGGGPDNGWYYLAASNIDWGQDLPALARWQKANGNPRMYVFYYGTAPLDVYGVDAVPPGERPLPAYVAISVTNYYLYNEMPLIQFLREEQEPIDYAGHSIHIYRIPQKLRKRIEAEIGHSAFGPVECYTTDLANL